jgi:hypothetical protein
VEVSRGEIDINQGTDKQSFLYNSHDASMVVQRFRWCKVARRRVARKRDGVKASDVKASGVV